MRIFGLKLILLNNKYTLTNVRTNKIFSAKAVLNL